MCIIYSSLERNRTRAKDQQDRAEKRSMRGMDRKALSRQDLLTGSKTNNRGIKSVFNLHKFADILRLTCCVGRDVPSLVVSVNRDVQTQILRQVVVISEAK